MLNEYNFFSVREGFGRFSYKNMWAELRQFIVVNLPSGCEQQFRLGVFKDEQLSWLLQSDITLVHRHHYRK